MLFRSVPTVNDGSVTVGTILGIDGAPEIVPQSRIVCIDGRPVEGDTPVWDLTTVWPGGFIESAQVRRTQAEPGRATFWVRTDVPLVAGEAVSTLASAVGLLDIANGMTTRVSPLDVAFPNLDTTVHFFAEPRGDWVGFDTTVSFGGAGIGLTHSVIHDVDGPVGVVTQILTIRPKR